MHDRFSKEGVTFDDVLLIPRHSAVLPPDVDINIEELKTITQFINISNGGLTESHPHDVFITKEAPNYQVL